MKYLNILIIEDETPLAEMHAEFIKRYIACRQIWLANNLEQGRLMIKNLKPDLIIIDHYLPDGKGITLLKELANRTPSPETIFITAANDMDTASQAIRYGAFDYLLKPVSYERLSQTLDRLSRLIRIKEQTEHLNQGQIDEMFNTFARIQTKPTMPLGIDEVTLKNIQNVFNNNSVSYTAESIAHKLGLSRTTARRYLEYCTKENFLHANIIYGKVGRPQRLYSLNSSAKK